MPPSLLARADERRRPNGVGRAGSTATCLPVNSEGPLKPKCTIGRVRTDQDLVVALIHDPLSVGAPLPVAQISNIEREDDACARLVA
jgi:hypothetical protein